MAKTKGNAKFVVELDGGVEGPMTGREVRDLALAGKVTPQTNIASFKGTDATLQWVPAERVKGTETNQFASDQGASRRTGQLQRTDPRDDLSRCPRLSAPLWESVSGAKIHPGTHAFNLLS